MLMCGFFIDSKAFPCRLVNPLSCLKTAAATCNNTAAILLLQLQRCRSQWNLQFSIKYWWNSIHLGIRSQYRHDRLNCLYLFYMKCIFSLFNISHHQYSQLCHVHAVGWKAWWDGFKFYGIFTQNSRLSTSCQIGCHQNNFMVVIQKVVKVVSADNQKVVRKTSVSVTTRWQLLGCQCDNFLAQTLLSGMLKKAPSLWQPWQP